MKRQDMTFRIIKIGKTAVSIAVCGLMATLGGGAAAQTLSTSSVVGQNVLDLSVSSVSYTGTGRGIVVYAQDFSSGSLNNGENTYTNPVTVTLLYGATITGATPTGGQLLGIYSSQVRDPGDTDNTGDIDSFTFAGSTDSRLVLKGGNVITGDVGYKLSFVGNAANGNYTASADPFDIISVEGDARFNGQVNASAIDVASAAGNITFLGRVDSDGSTGGTATVLDYNGHNVSVTLGPNIVFDGAIINKGGASNTDSALGDRTNGTLVVQGAATVTGAIGDSTSGLSLISVNGSGSAVDFQGSVTSNQLDFGAASNVTVTGSLIMTPDAAPSEVKGVTFNDKDGSLTIVGGNLTGLAGQAVVSNSVSGRGTLTAQGVAGALQTVTGDLGKTGLALKQVNIGGPASNNYANVLVNGNVNALTVSLNNNGTADNSTLSMASGYNITGNVVTDENGMGNLTLLGGTQTVTGTVGASNARLNTVTSGNATAASSSTFTDVIYASTVTNSGGASTGATTSSSTYKGNVYAGTVNVGNGVSTFEAGLSTYASGPVATINITSGIGNFNTVTGSTTGNIVFGGAGTANLNQSLTGTVAFGGHDATVNLADAKAISGNISTTTNNTGILNALGGANLNGNVGANGAAIKNLNINTGGTTSKTVYAQGDVYAQTVSLQNDGVLRMATGKNLTGTVVTTTPENAPATGSLLLDGTSIVTGNVGVAGNALKSITAGASSSISTFNSGVVYANTLAYSGDGNVVFNGSAAGAAVDDKGFIGTVDFGTNLTSTGTFTLGNNVDLITQNAANPANNTQTSFVDANRAKLRFVGSSTVTGNLGAADNAGNQNFGSVYADGNTDSVVDFLGEVYVSGSTFYVNGTGTVNFQDNLYGPLQYLADGTVNVADGKSIYPTTDGSGAGYVQTYADNKGSLNYLGSTTTQVDVGTSEIALEAVNFHSATDVGTATVNIGHSVYATNTTIGNASGTTTANITASGKYLGANLTLSNTTTLNTAGIVSAYGLLTNGTLAPSGVVTQSLIGSGALTANDSTMNFAVGTQAWSEGVGGLVDAAGSSKITGASGSTLSMGLGSTVNVTLLGSLRDAEQVTLIDVTSAGNTNVPAYQDNSYVIGTALTRVDGDLVMTATRDASTYVTQSDTSGHFSNPAATRLGTLAAAGTGYGQDMQAVLNKLDIDQWGYGNNQANLATQVKRLAPIANNSVGLSSMAMGSMVSNNIGVRMHELRNVPQTQSFETSDFWVKTNILSGKQTALGDYDGYTAKLSGLTMGVDSRPDNHSIVGVALTYGTGTVRQTQFREGEQANLKSWQVSLYGAYDFTPELFVGGVLSMARQNTSGNRATVVGRTALYDVNGTESGYKLDLGYRLKFEDSTTILTPLLSLEGRSFKQNAYSETNAGDVGLSVAEQRLQSRQAGLGLRLSSTEYVGGMVFKPELAIFSMRDSARQMDPISASYIGDASGASSFNTSVASYSPRSTKVSLGAGLLMSKMSSIVARYQYVKRDTFSSNMAELIARWNF